MTSSTGLRKAAKPLLRDARMPSGTPTMTHTTTALMTIASVVMVSPHSPRKPTKPSATSANTPMRQPAAHHASRKISTSITSGGTPCNPRLMPFSSHSTGFLMAWKKGRWLV